MATSVVFPRVQFFANNGRPLIGGRIHTYVAGSSTRAPTYKDAAKAQPNTNPIVLDARGEAAVYLSEGVEYKFVLEDNKGALILTQEPVYGAIWPNAESWPSDATLSYQYMTEAKAAAGAIGPIKFYDTYAQAMGDIANLAEDDLIEVSRDETLDSARTRYRVEGGALVFVVNLDQLRMDLAAAAGATRVGYKNPVQASSVARSIDKRMSDTAALGDFGAGDTATFAEFNAAVRKSAMGIIPPGVYTNAMVDSHFSRTTNLRAREAGREKILVGAVAAPNTQDGDRVPVWVQKVVAHDAPSQFTHMIGAGLFEHMAAGSGSAGAPNKGTWIGLYGNSVLAGKNVGSEAAPATDVNGNVIGIAGFAASDFLPGDGRIITALWGYAASPAMTDTEVANTTGSWSAVGLEINVAQRHKSPGRTQYLGGNKGATAGVYLVNYQELAEQRKSWQFGIVLHGTQLNGDTANTDPTTWSGYHVGIQLDKIKDVGINFQVNAENSKTIGIKFPVVNDASGRGYKTAIAIGNNKINLGQYYRGDSDPYDLWHNGDQIYWKMGNGTTAKLPILLGYFPSTGFLQSQKMEIRVGNKILRIPCEIIDYVG